MKRIRKLCVFLLLGAIINVAVAWGFMRLHGGPQPTYNAALPANPRPLTPSEERWSQANMIPWLREHMHELSERGTPVAQEQLQAGWRRTDITEYYRKPGDKRYSSSTMLERTEVGWPLRSVFVESGGLSRPASTYVDSCALWPGFAINTIFYAAIVWLLFAFPFVIRRCRRIKRGLCPACAYPVGDSAVCTECGSVRP